MISMKAPLGVLMVGLGLLSLLNSLLFLALFIVFRSKPFRALNGCCGQLRTFLKSKYFMDNESSAF